MNKSIPSLTPGSTVRGGTLTLPRITRHFWNTRGHLVKFSTAIEHRTVNSGGWMLVKSEFNRETPFSMYSSF